MFSPALLIPILKALPVNLNQYVCSICKKAFADNNSLNVHHDLTHIKNKKFACDLCKKSFFLESSLRRHLKENHIRFFENARKNKGFPTFLENDVPSRKLNSVRNQLCTKAFLDKFSEITLKITPVGNKFSCDFCEKSFILKATLDLHYKEDHSDIKKEFLCKECPKKFPRYDSLLDHLRLHAEEKNKKNKNVVCDKCGEKFRWNSTLIVHKRIHEDRIFECDVCKKKFSAYRSYKIHLNYHSKLGHFPCYICEKVFLRKNSLKKHLTSHSGEKDFLCEICGKAFFDKGGLKKHLFCHTGIKPYQCNICQKRFTGSTSLQNHMRIHSGERPFVCKTCGKAFNMGHILKMHEYTHTEQKPFKCDICVERRFIHKDSLLRHMQIHYGVKPYVLERPSDENDNCFDVIGRPFACDQCNKRYKKRADLTRHQRIHLIFISEHSF